MSYNKEYYEAHKEQYKARTKIWYQNHKDKQKEYRKVWYQKHKEEQDARNKAYLKAHEDEIKEYQKSYYKEWSKFHERKEYLKEYRKSDVNSSGQTKDNVRNKSRYYLTKHGNKIKGYEIHHCCTYNEPYKFIYCSKEMHKLIHAYLREHNIDADSNHYEQIKHLLDETVVLYGV